MLSKIKHPNIVLLMAIVSKPPNLCIVTEYVSYGSLYQILHQYKKDITYKEKVAL